MSTIEIPHLRLLAVFAIVIESKSFAAAARQLRTSRSRVSEQVSQLEEVLGVRLLQRSTRQLLITREGEGVYEEARKLSDLIKRIEAIVTPTEPVGRVVLTMNHDIAHRFVLPALEKFRDKYPLISLDLVLDDNVVDMIAEQIDVAIRIGLPKDSSLIGRVLHQESFSVYASPDFLKVHGTPRTVEQLQKCQWIVLSQFDYQNVFKFRQKSKYVELAPAQYHSCNSPYMMQKMVENGLGVGALLPSTVTQLVKNKKLVKLMPSLSSEPLMFTLVYPSRQNVPQRTRVLIDFLLSANLFGSD